MRPQNNVYTVFCTDVQISHWDNSGMGLFSVAGTTTSQCKKKRRCAAKKIEKSGILCQKCNVPCQKCNDQFYTVLTSLLHPVPHVIGWNCGNFLPNFPVFNIALIFFFRSWQWRQDSVKIIQTDSATNVVNWHLLKKSAALQAISRNCTRRTFIVT